MTRLNPTTKNTTAIEKIKAEFRTIPSLLEDMQERLDVMEERVKEQERLNSNILENDFKRLNSCLAATSKLNTLLELREEEARGIEEMYQRIDKLERQQQEQIDMYHAILKETETWRSLLLKVREIVGEEAPPKLLITPAPRSNRMADIIKAKKEKRS
jgi:hypothetical protein